MFVGDNHHLALAYYQSGLPEAAWELLQGTTLESMFVQLGNNCLAMVLNRKLRPGVKLQNFTLETLSQEVVIGLMGVSLINPQR